MSGSRRSTEGHPRTDEPSTEHGGGLSKSKADAPASRVGALTPREHEVMWMLAHGATGTEIAEALVISHETVRSRTRSARRRLGARTRIHAIALAVHSGEIEM